MGVRKKNTSDTIKANKKKKALAILRKCPTSPRKMRLIADNIRGMNVNKALNLLKNNPKDVALRIESFYSPVCLIGKRKMKIKKLKMLI